MRMSRCLAPLLAVLLTLPAAAASHHGEEIAQLVAEQGLQVYEEMPADADGELESPLLVDSRGKRNIAETNLNFAVALLASNTEEELARQVVSAVLEHQDTVEGSPTRGLFRWFADEAEDYSADATMYIAPTLAHLARTVEGRDLRGDLEQRAALAAEGLLNMRERPRRGYGGAMWAGAVMSLAEVTGDDAAASEGGKVVGSTLEALRRRGPGGVHSPTFDALRIGGLRWAWQHAPDDQARDAAEAALGICYADMLQRYDPEIAMVTGAVGRAYAADYLGEGGVARYLLACDLPSALEGMTQVTPLAMYFALSGFRPDEELLALEQIDSELEMRTRTPDPERQAPEQFSTCTWRTRGLSLGTMSGTVTGSSIPILATYDVQERPASYFYVFGGPATVHSAQAGPLSISSFDFDEVGVGRRLRVGVRGVLGPRDQIDRVLINTEEWIGEPEAIGQGGTIAVRRGSSYIGVRILAVGAPDSPVSDRKPARVEWFAEGEMDTLRLTIFGRSARYALSQPLYDVRVGVLVEVAPMDEFGSLDEFAGHIAGRRVNQNIREERERIEDEEERRIPGRHEITPRVDQRYARYRFHEMTLRGEKPRIGLEHEMMRNRLVSRKLPFELPDSYLWISPGLTMIEGGEVIDFVAE